MGGRCFYCYEAVRMNEKRNYSRVDAKIAFGTRQLDPGGISQSGSRIEGRRESCFPDPPTISDPALNEWLTLLNAKLDALLGQWPKRESIGKEMIITPVNLGAGGVAFNSDKKYSPGDILEIQMELPLPNDPVTVIVLSEVIWTGMSKVAVQFIEMTEYLREKIAEYVLYREREILMAENL